MTDLFIKKATLIHGDTYDYSKVEYKNARDKIIIICKIHGEFLKSPNKHLSSNQGCKICSHTQLSNKFSSNTNEFIKKAILIHGDKYNYSKVNYINSKNKIIIICSVHGEFLQQASNHLWGYGCINCRNDNSGSSQRLTNENFIKKAQTTHIDKNGLPLYKYDNVEYINAHIPVKITCNIHGIFKQKPNNHLNGATCLKCSNELSSERQRMTIKEFIQKAIQIHNNKYDYSKSIYGTNNSIPIDIICNIHGIFQQTPTSHLSGHGCNICAYDSISFKQRLPFEEWLPRFKKIHNDKYDYSMVEYTNSDKNIKIRCYEHDITFYQTPSNHLKSTGCKKCHKSGYSIKACIWLKFISIFYNINILHAENCNEFNIPNTKLYADGYCAITNTIYEFHGDFWHGNPKKYNINDINVINKKTFGELYKNTLLREEKIKSLGYNLVVMWESDWNKINKSIKTLQQQFKIKYL